MTIRLPVVTRLTVTGYELYPGLRGKGIDWQLLRGVSVIAGVNGLGKTTLLNILFRMLAGAKDWTVGESRQLGNLNREVKDTRDTSYFRDRVSDGAANARASVEIRFGRTKVAVTRRLRDLSIVELSVDGVAMPATGEAFENTVLEASGISSGFDWHLILRLLVFYFEDRRPLVWDRTAQDEVLRALFYPTESARAAADLANEIQRRDSEFRNRRVFLNKQVQRLDEAEAAAAGDATARHQFAAKLTEVTALRERSTELGRAVDSENLERVRTRRQVEGQKLRLEETTREHHALRQRFFSSLFPGITEVGNYILVNLDSGSGCVVCGNTGADAAHWLAKCVADGTCPVCVAPAERQDVRPMRQSKVEARKLTELEARRRSEIEVLGRAQEALALADERFRELALEHDRTALALGDAERQLDIMRATLPPPPDELDAMRRMVEDLKRQQNENLAVRRKLESELRVHLDNGRAAVDAVASSIRKRFAANADAFLAESCEIGRVREYRMFGDGTGKFSMPRFTVKLTSGVFKSQAQERRDDDDVSESQKEFIDLAFRLALLQEVSGTRPAMIVIETPEASLDSLFIARAGQLLAKFARGGGQLGNRLIASSNLNKEDMIPALFGLASEEDYIEWWRTHRSGHPRASRDAVPVAERPKRLLNLLAVAAENRAVERYRAGYELRLRRALEPDWSKAPPAARTQR